MPDRTRILLFGHDGQIGWELHRRLGALGDVHAVSYPDVDFARVDALRFLVRQLRPELIVNAAAYTAVDRAEQEPDVAHAVNAVAPAVLAEEARSLNALLVHYSTDFVFGGEGDRPYTEDDRPRPLSVYGQTKWQGDQGVQAAGGAHFIFRVSWIYGMRGKNFLLTMRRLAAEGRHLKVVDDQVGTPTWCRCVAKATVEVVTASSRRGRLGETNGLHGLYHMTCSGSTSWHGFASAFLPASAAVEAIPSSEYPTAATRPAYSVLDCSRLRDTFGIRMPRWQDALKDCLNDAL